MPTMKDDRLISLNAAIELVRDVCDAIMSGCESWYDPETKDEVYEDIREVNAILKCNKEVRIALRNLPSTQPGEDIRAMCGECDAWNQYKNYPQPGWIPCSTALPRDEEEVIVSIHDDSGDYARDYTSFGWYAAAGKFWVVDNEVNMRVTAWMPLPKPWEGR